MDALARAAALLPGDYRQALRAGAAGVEEIRLRCGRAPTLLCGGTERPFSERLCRREDLLHVLEKASGASLHTVADELRGYFGERVYETVIPRNVRLAEAPSHGKPVTAYDGSSKGAKAYRDAAKEFLERQGEHGR